MAAPPPEIAPKTPKALARSFGSWKVTLIRARAAGASSAANAALQGAGGEQQAAGRGQATDARRPAAKPRRPTRKVRLRPQ